MTHPVLTDLPAWQAHQQRLTDLKANERKWLQRRQADDDTYREALTAHQAAAREALLAGSVPPPPPEPPPADNSAHVFQAERRQLRATERALLVENVAEIEAAAKQRERELCAEITSVADELQPVVEELNDLAAALSNVRRAVHVADDMPPPFRPATRESLSLTEVMGLVSNGEAPLDPIPKTGLS